MRKEEERKKKKKKRNLNSLLTFLPVAHDTLAGKETLEAMQGKLEKIM